MRRHVWGLRAALAVLLGLVALGLLPGTPASAANLYPYGQCTYYAKKMRPDVGNHWGNARNWAASARQAGFPVSATPRAGDIVVLQPGVQRVNRTYGHVAYVTTVRGTWFRTVSMWGNEANGRLHVVWYHTGPGVSFIHKRIG